MALGLSVASDIANMALTYFVRGKTFKQTIQEKPLIRLLQGSQQSFPGGKDNVSYPVQGVFMNSTAGFFAGFTEDDALAFTQAANALRAAYAWKEVAASLIISETELKKDGISVNDTMKTSEHSQVELTRLTGILQNRMDDFTESWARAFNDMLWKDGTADTKSIPGVKSIITDTPDTGTTGGLDRATYTWWRHRYLPNIAMSETNQTLAKTLRKEVRQLKRYGGRPNALLCGSLFLDALEQELQAKGLYSQIGFANAGKNDIGIAQISMLGVGQFEYDPTLDDLGESNACYILDTRKLTLHPMEGEENKVRSPERPYNYLVFLHTMTYTGALGARQLNCHGKYTVAVS